MNVDYKEKDISWITREKHKSDFEIQPGILRRHAWQSNTRPDQNDKDIRRPEQHPFAASISQQG